MRIIVGVHPLELDDQRLLWQNGEVRLAISFFNASRASGTTLPTSVQPWDTPRGVAAILYYHTLTNMALSARGYTLPEHSNVKVHTSLLTHAHNGSDEIGGLFKDGNHTGMVGTPQKWPPAWISSEQKIADLMDLQNRWRRDGDTLELERSIERYGDWPGGSEFGHGTGLGTDPATITTDQVACYLEHRENRKRQLEAAKNG